MSKNLKVKKVDVLNFLDKVEHKAIESIKREYQEKINAVKQSNISEYGIDKKAEDIQKLLNYTSDILDEIIEITNNSEGKMYYNVENYNNPYRSIKNLLGRDFYNNIINFITHQNIEGLKLQQKADENLVYSEYQKVKAICKEFPNGTKAYQYLKELGFDVSSIPTNQNNALVTVVNKDLLFVCGENK